MDALTIILPSNRNFEASRSAIETAIIFAEKTGARVIVSDNSGDLRKRDHFNKASDHLLYLVGPAIDGAANQIHALNHAETPWVMPMGDDDEIYRLDTVTALSFDAIPAGVIGIRPRSFIWTLDKGVQQADCFSIQSDTAGDRIAEYNTKARGNNALYYAIFRTDVFRGLMTLFAGHHPTKGGYCDWAIVFALVAGGRILFDPSMIYRYDLGRWATQSGLAEAKENLFVRAGLPARAEDFTALLRFVDLHCFLAWPGLPLDTDARTGAMAANIQTALANHVVTVLRKPEYYGPTVSDLAKLMQKGADINTILQLSFDSLDQLQAGLGQRYRGFLETAARFR